MISLARLRPSDPRRVDARRPLTGAVLRLALVAAAMSAAKVTLYAAGGGALLGGPGVAALPWFYLALALVAGPLALWIAGHTENHDPARVLLLALAAAAVLGPGLILLGLAVGPVAGIGLLAFGHLFNIVTEMLLWLVAARWFPAPELRRSTVWVFMAYAGGGFTGGMLLDLGIARLGIHATSVLLVAIGSVSASLVLWRSLRLPNGGGLLTIGPLAEPADPSPLTALRGFLEIVRPYPLAALLALSFFMLTFVYVLTEYVCFMVFARDLGGEVEITAAFARIYAAAQALELLSVVVLVGPLTCRIGPVLRNVLFPLGALATLVWLWRRPDLVAAAVALLWTEGISNGVFDPVHAANYAALPAETHARVRAVTDGLAYPLGMATAGGVLVFIGPEGAMGMALVGAVLFVATGLFVGLQLVPSLFAALRLDDLAAPRPSRRALREARARLAPWAARSRVRQRLLRRATGAFRTRLIAADQRALDEALAACVDLDRGGAVARLRRRLDDPDPARRALAVEALSMLSVRDVLAPFRAALQRLYLPDAANLAWSAPADRKAQAAPSRTRIRDLA